MQNFAPDSIFTTSLAVSEENGIEISVPSKEKEQPTDKYFSSYKK
jgi:hypothetical protein